MLFIFMFSTSVIIPSRLRDNDAMNRTQHLVNVATFCLSCCTDPLLVYFFFFLLLFFAAFLAAFFASASAISAKIFWVSSSASTSVVK